MSHAIIIAHNELRLLTYRFGKTRKFIFIILFSLGLFWAIYFGPYLIDLIIPEIIKLFEYFNYHVFVDIVEYSFMTIFLFAFMFPLFDLYRKKEIGYLEAVLATPIKPRDIFLADIIWRIPIQFLIVLIIGPLITGLLIQLNHLNHVYFIIVNIMLFVLIVSGNVSGKLLANLIERKMTQSKIIVKFNKLILYLMSIIVICLFYLIRFSLSLFLDNPELKQFLIFFPSFWYTNIILYLIDPTSYSSFLLLSILLAFIFPLMIIFISYKIARPIFEMNIPAKKKQVIKIEERRFSGFIKKYIISKEKKLMLIQSKVFFRTHENISKLIYILFFSILMGIMVSISWNQPWNLTQGFQDKYLIILIIAWMGGFFFGLLLGINVFINSKEMLFVYKRSPKGIKSLIISYLFFMAYLILIFNIILTIIYTFLFQFTFVEIIMYFISYFLYSMMTMILAIGIQCFNPLFEERKNTALFNSYLILLVHVSSFFLTFCISVPLIPISIEASIGLTNFTIIQFMLALGLSITIYLFGLIRIQKIE